MLFLKSCILPPFDYCDIVCSGCTKHQSLHLETLVNFGCCITLRKHKDYYATAALNEIGLSTLASRRKLYLVQMMFKCLSSQSPSYLCELFSPPTSCHFTRSCILHQLNLPPVRTTLGQKPFTLMGTSLWRSQPSKIRGNMDYRLFSSESEVLFQH